MDESGVVNGIPWSVRYLGDRDFKLTVGHLEETFTCTYPLIFGIDASDSENMNKRMDEMQEKVEKRIIKN